MIAPNQGKLELLRFSGRGEFVHFGVSENPSPRGLYGGLSLGQGVEPADLNELVVMTNPGNPTPGVLTPRHTTDTASVVAVGSGPVLGVAFRIRESEMVDTDATWVSAHVIEHPPGGHRAVPELPCDDVCAAAPAARDAEQAVAGLVFSGQPLKTHGFHAGHDGAVYINFGPKPFRWVAFDASDGTKWIAGARPTLPMLIAPAAAVVLAAAALDRADRRTGRR